MSRSAVGTRGAKRGRLAQRRKAVGLTQEQLAEQLGVERSTVARWERGETRPLPWLRPKLATALGVSADRVEELLAAGDTPASPRGTVAAVPRQLPAAVADFTGRAAELQALTRMLDRSGTGAPGTVVISAIGGTAGVGKTALALHWAHQVADRFPAGQLHVNLRGFDPSGTPACPSQAIRGFLDALGVQPERIPRDLEAQAGLYRSLLADKRMLIVLDNARDEQQVRPLLPASPGSLVLVTSRSQLNGLAVADGARLVTLDVLSHAEAVHLLTARIGAERAAAESAAVDRIASLCACLPLALGVVAARGAARPGLPLAALAAELAASSSRLDMLETGDPATSVGAVFSWSYRQLSTDAAHMFRMLGLHPGPDISVPAAASLTACDQPEARRLLRELSRCFLVAEHVPGRYAFHDLLRAYALAEGRQHDSEAERNAATGRVLDHYLHTGGPASTTLDPSRGPLALAPPSHGTAPEPLADHRKALAWFEAEHHVLLAVVTVAESAGFDSHAWQLSWAMVPYLRNRGHYQERAAVMRTALAAATRLGDKAGQAVSARLLAAAYTDLRDDEQAVVHYASSITLYQQLGDRRGEAIINQSLAMLADRQGRYADALRYNERALVLYQAIGDKAGEASALGGVGWYHALLGDYERARAYCRRGLTLSGELDYRLNEGHIWDSLGYAEQQLGNHAEAAVCYGRALDILREFGIRVSEATTLTHLGDTRHDAGELAEACDAWQQALVIFDDLQHPDAEQIRAKLASAAGYAPSDPSR